MLGNAHRGVGLHQRVHHHVLHRLHRLVGVHLMVHPGPRAEDLMHALPALALKADLVVDDPAHGEQLANVEARLVLLAVARVTRQVVQLVHVDAVALVGDNVVQKRGLVGVAPKLGRVGAHDEILHKAELRRVQAECLRPAHVLRQVVQHGAAHLLVRPLLHLCRRHHPRQEFVVEHVAERAVAQVMAQACDFCAEDVGTRLVRGHAFCPCGFLLLAVVEQPAGEVAREVADPDAVLESCVIGAVEDVGGAAQLAQVAEPLELGRVYDLGQHPPQADLLAVHHVTLEAHLAEQPARLGDGCRGTCGAAVLRVAVRCGRGDRQRLGDGVHLAESDLIVKVNAAVAVGVRAVLHQRRGQHPLRVQAAHSAGYVLAMLGRLR
mmetsp:Transcript_10141/g.25970  ORF Transcript_10141/g.25970 Transcript_10141/m.25970 type:complete len:379 (+) Transcript_10141:955-2091(+)